MAPILTAGSLSLLQAPSWGLCGRAGWAPRPQTPSVAEMTVDPCGRAHGAALPHRRVGLSPAGGGAIRHRRGAALSDSGSSQRGNVHFARETLARLRRLAPAAVTVRADAGFFSYDMIAAIGAHGASYSITIPQNAKVKAAIAAIDDDAWASIEYTRGGEAQVVRPPSKPAAAATSSAATTARPRSCGSSCAAPACSAPRPSCGPTGATTASSPTECRHRAAGLPPSPRQAPGSCPSGRFPANGAWLACCVSRTPRPLDRPPRTRPPHAPAHRRGHHRPPAPHSAGPPRQPQRPPQAPPAAQLAATRPQTVDPTNPSVDSGLKRCRRTNANHAA